MKPTKFPCKVSAPSPYGDIVLIVTGPTPDEKYGPESYIAKQLSPFPAVELETVAKSFSSYLGDDTWDDWDLSQFTEVVEN